MGNQVILGVMFRALGAHPAGWRQPGAHTDPLGDAAVLRRTAEVAERAKLDYMFIGDWLATGPDLQFRDPYLLARIEPLSAISFLAGVTSRIGLIATANTTYSDPYTVARRAGSIDVLSSGRAGLNVVTGAEPRAAGNHGRDAHWGNEERYDRAIEFVELLRLLWDSWEDDAFVADQRSGVLIDPARLHDPLFEGRHLSVSGALNVARPPQGHLPIVHAGTSPRSRELVSELADLALVAVPTRDAAVEMSRGLRQQAVAAGRDPGLLKVITPILPVVGETDFAAQDIYDRLLTSVPLDDGVGRSVLPGFPQNRSIRALSTVLGVELGDLSLDVEVSRSNAERFNEVGDRLVDQVAARTGRTVGGRAPIAYRHLLASHVVPSAAVVGSATTVADHIEDWSESGAVDGFNILTAFLGEQFDAFADWVVPELRRRGIFRQEYTGDTLRDHLGLPRPANRHAVARERIERAVPRTA